MSVKALGLCLGASKEQWQENLPLTGRNHEGGQAHIGMEDTEGCRVKEEQKERWGRGEGQKEERSYLHHRCKNKTETYYTEGGG